MNSDKQILWKVHLRSSPEVVYDALNSDSGRASFWAEKAEERDNRIFFEFIDGEKWIGDIKNRERASNWAVNYFGWTAEFRLLSDGNRGTDVTLIHHKVSSQYRSQFETGWLNVLLPMKAAIDFGVDLHSHDVQRTWSQKYVDH